MRARAAILAVTIIAFASCGGGTKRDPITDARDQCVFLSASSDAPATDMPDDFVLAGFCSMAIDRLDGGYSITLFKPDASSMAVLGNFGKNTGCFNDVDLQKMIETRALDGRVESANQRSSWTYHPDNGLKVICNK